MADPVAELKKKLLTKLRGAGAPKVVTEAIDLLSPDDLQDVGLTAAAALIPIPGASEAKLAKKALKFGVRAAGPETVLESAAEKIALRSAREAVGKEVAQDIPKVAGSAGLIAGAAAAIDKKQTMDEDVEELKKLVEARKATGTDKKSLRKLKKPEEVSDATTER
jgi:metal-dependent amidase/aminoacylase/carboxypeptidase family protein